MKKNNCPDCRWQSNIETCDKCFQFSNFMFKKSEKTHHTLLITLPIATYNYYAKAGKRKIKPAIEQSLIDLAELQELLNC